MNIADREIGSEQAPFVIAEIGVNHDGSLERALGLVRACAQAGADAVKFQLFQADLLLGKEAKLAAYQRASGAEDPFAMLRALEMGVDALSAVVETAHNEGLHAIVSIFSVELVEPAGQLAWDAFKTASPDIVHHPLLRAIAAQGRPMIVSTGTASADEVVAASACLHEVTDLAFLHCVSSYPTPLESAQLAGVAAIADLRISGHIDRSFEVGYSDHTSDVETGALAVAAGAVILEKHVTHDRSATGPDHSASLEPADLESYVKAARRAASALGERRKSVGELEMDVRSKSRQSITSARDLPAGHCLRREDLTFKRPGTGILPSDLTLVLGMTTRQAIEADVPILPGMLQ